VTEGGQCHGDDGGVEDRHDRPEDDHGRGATDLRGQDHFLLASGHRPWLLLCKGRCDQARRILKSTQRYGIVKESCATLAWWDWPKRSSSVCAPPSRVS